jgi:hypothetical protein
MFTIFPKNVDEKIFTKFKKSKSVGIGGLESIKSNSKRLSILA